MIPYLDTVPNLHTPNLKQPPLKTFLAKTPVPCTRPSIILVGLLPNYVADHLSVQLTSADRYYVQLFDALGIGSQISSKYHPVFRYNSLTVQKMRNEDAHLLLKKLILCSGTEKMALASSDWLFVEKIATAGVDTMPMLCGD